VADPSVRYPQELRERAVRLVAESRPDHATEGEAMRSVAQKLDIWSTETVCRRVATAVMTPAHRHERASRTRNPLRRESRGLVACPAGDPRPDTFRAE
jgi:transposase